MRMITLKYKSFIFVTCSFLCTASCVITASEATPARPLNRAPLNPKRQRAVSAIEESLRTEIALLSKTLAAQQQATQQAEKAFLERGQTLQRHIDTIENRQEQITELMEENIALKQKNRRLHTAKYAFKIRLEAFCSEAGQNNRVEQDTLALIAKYKTEDDMG